MTDQIVDTWDISGMGGGYELGCQKMLWAGLKFLSKDGHPTKILDERQEYQNIYGMCKLPDSFKECEEVMMDAVERDCTGAMMQCVTGHIEFIAKNGMDKWHEELREGRREEQSFKFNLTKMEIVDG